MSSSNNTSNKSSQQPFNEVEFNDEQAAGNWELLLQRSAFVNASSTFSSADKLALKRRFSLAYLGPRAQFMGGVYTSTQPSVFTPAVISRLERGNTAKRFERYPWLYQLVQILQKLDQNQHFPSYKISEEPFISDVTPCRRLKVVPTSIV
jgi:hypothetical protein